MRMDSCSSSKKWMANENQILDRKSDMVNYGHDYQVLFVCQKRDIV